MMFGTNSIYKILVDGKKGHIPEPVVAHAHRSFPRSAWGIAVDWISVGLMKFNSFIAYKWNFQIAEYLSNESF